VKFGGRKEERMNWNRCIALSIASLCLSATFAFSEEWSLFFENHHGIRFYTDRGSTQRTPKGTILVWEKVVSSDNAIRMETLNEADCSRRQYKVLQGTVYGRGVKPFGKSKGWKRFRSSDLDRARHDAFCGKGRK